MDRRAFLSLAGFSLLSAPWGERAAARPVLPAAEADFCRSQRTLPLLAAGGEGALSYQGTHILAHGALKDLAAAYGASGRGRLTVAGGGCDDGIAGVLRGLTDFGGMCCPTHGTPAERLPHLWVATDLKALVAHGSNPVSGLTLAELEAVARGRIADWRELGGASRPIAQVVRRHCPDYLEPVRAALLGNRDEWSPRALFVDTDEQIVDLVSRFPAAFGVVSWVYARPLVQTGKLAVLALDGRRPDRDRGRYPLTGPLTMLIAGWDAARMVPFFDFLYGPQGRELIARDLLPAGREAAGYRGAATFGRA
jgi:phosphate transport system substrate-binding protein